MKILIIGIGAFGFSIGKLLGENNIDNEFDGYCNNEIILNNIKNNREHPYFFKGKKLPENIILKNKLENIDKYDFIILATPSITISGIIDDIKDKLKKGVIIINLAKGINNESLQTMYELILDKLKGKDYTYATLSGGMIAEEVVNGVPLGADLGILNKEIGEKIKKLFENKNFNINISSEIKNIELYGSLKNIGAIITGYYIGKGYGYSTIGKYISEFYNEMKLIIFELGGDKKIDFGNYSLGGDLIATCFGNSRNREFGELLGKGFSGKQALEEMKNRKKYVEGYNTLKAINKLIENKKGFNLTKNISKIVLEK